MLIDRHLLRHLAEVLAHHIERNMSESPNVGNEEIIVQIIEDASLDPLSHSYPSEPHTMISPDMR